MKKLTKQQKIHFLIFSWLYLKTGDKFTDLCDCPFAWMFWNKQKMPYKVWFTFYETNFPSWYMAETETKQKSINWIENELNSI
jgi:hypothetical protein